MENHIREIQPIETFVFDGLIKRFSTVFGCRALLTTTNDKEKTVKRFFDGRPVEYPYAFLTVQSLARNKDSYQNRSLARRGIPIVVGQDQVQTARLIPTSFAIEVEFHTNKYQGQAPTTVLGYARRWLFAAECGYLKFNIQYGRLETRIGVTMDDTVSTPPLENKVETEAVYKIVSNLVVHGYASEPILGSQGVISEVDLQLALSLANGTAEGYVFEPFN
jgi:hypothetical protein